jgi:polygalacturonase
MEIDRAYRNNRPRHAASCDDAAMLGRLMMMMIAPPPLLPHHDVVPLLLLLPLLQLLLAQPATASRVFDVRSFGAVGDAHTNDTAAVRQAARALAAVATPDDAEGAVLLFPRGYHFLTGSFNLSSHSTLRVEGTLAGIQPRSPDTAHYDYPIIRSPPSYNDGMVHASLIHGRALQNVSLTGGGLVWGGGDAWWRWVGYSFNRTGGMLCADDSDCANTLNATCHGNTCKAPTATGLSAGRPHTIHMWSVQGLTIHNLTVMRSPAWTVRLSYCQGVLVDSVRVITNDTARGAMHSGQPPAQFQPANTDAIDLDSCSNVHVRNSVFVAHDDGIALKSGKDWWGRHVGKPTQNVLVEDCFSSSFVGAAFAIGSETSGGIRNVTVRGLRSHHTELGLSIKTERGRGAAITDVRFEGVQISNTACAAVQVNMRYHVGIPAGNDTTTPRIERIDFSHVTATDVVGHPGFCMPLGLDITTLSLRHHTQLGPQPQALLQGLPESHLQNIMLNNVHLSGPSSSVEALQCSDAVVIGSSLTVDGEPQHNIICRNSSQSE